MTKSQNIKESSVILAICDEGYFQKSSEEGSGVFFEINEIAEHELFKKVIPIKISATKLPYNFQTLEYIPFEKEFIEEKICSSLALDNLFVKIAELLSREDLYPNDRIIPEVFDEINSLGILANVLNNPSLTLSAIYTYPDLGIESEKEIKYISVRQYLQDKKYFGRSIIVGDRQSGKSSLSKKLFLDLFDLGMQPVFLDKMDFTSRNTEKIISEKYIKIYSTIHRRKKQNIIILVDDYSTLDIKYRDDILRLKDYAGIIVFVDDIFDIGSQKEFSFVRYTIQPMRPSLRANLIEKLIVTQNIKFPTENDRLKRIDENTRLINMSLGLGKGYKNGILPAFPLYILIILGAAGDTRSKLDSPVSYHGHCYQLLISLTFQNCGIENDRIDSYINFLTYFSYFLYQKGNKELNQREFDEFIHIYKEQYSIYKEEEYLRRLLDTGLLKKTNSSYYTFSYDYIYYFFLGKYLAESFEEEQRTIEKIIDNLDVGENGNICIFLAHHSKNSKLIEILQNNLSEAFKDYSPARLDKTELIEVDESIQNIVSDIKVKIGNYSEERKQELALQDNLEGDVDIEYNSNLKDLSDEERRQNDIRKAIQTVEVVGVILKNRHGSIRTKDYENLLQGAIDANLRLLSSFIEIMTNKRFIEEFELYIFRQYEFQEMEKWEKFREKIRKVLSTIIFSTIYGVMLKTIDSIGSEVVSYYFSDTFSSQHLSPSYMIVRRGLELQYEKRLSEKEIVAELTESNMSHIAQAIIKLMIIDHASKHSYNFKEKSKIEALFGFKANTIFNKERRFKQLDS